MTDCGDNPPPFEVIICIGIHYQEPGLISPFLYEGHHFCMPHAFNVHAIYLMQTETLGRGFMVRTIEAGFVSGITGNSDFCIQI